MKPLLETLPGWPPAFSSEVLGIPLWVNCEGDSKPVGGWISQAGLTKIASGQVPDVEDIKKETDLYGYEKRTGIKVDRGTKTAADTMIYSAKFLRLENDVSFFAIVEGVSEEVARVLANAKVIRWGGEGRQFAMEAEIRSETPVSEPRQTAVGAGWALAILTSPAFLASGCQSTPGGPKALASGKPIAISGWDMARACPKNTRFAWPAGTTLFFDQGDYDKLGDDFFGSPEDMSLGYGSFMEGHWDYE